METISQIQTASTTRIHSEMEEIEAAKKDPSAFSVLYDRYYIPIFRYVYQRVETEDEAADLTSQAFLKALSNIERYEHRGLPFSSWLYRIARNEVYLNYRKLKKERTYFTEDEGLEQIASETEDHSIEDNIQLLLQMLSKLSSDEMELVEMRYFEKRPFMEIAEILNISENNAKVKMHRIIKKLQKLVHKN